MAAIGSILSGTYCILLFYFLFILFFGFFDKFFLFLSFLFFISLFQSHSSSTFLHTGPSEVRRLHNRGRLNGQLFSSLTTVFLCPSSAFPVLSLKYFTPFLTLYEFKHTLSQEHLTTFSMLLFIRVWF